MAKRTVGDWDGEGKREVAEAAGLDEALSALSKSMAAQAKELAARLMESGSSAPRVDGLVREAVLEAGRRGPEEAECDRSDCGAANAPRCCGGRMRFDAAQLTSSNYLKSLRLGRMNQNELSPPAVGLSIVGEGSLLSHYTLAATARIDAVHAPQQTLAARRVDVERGFGPR